jgi:hypothetical protein
MIYRRFHSMAAAALLGAALVRCSIAGGQDVPGDEGLFYYAIENLATHLVEHRGTSRGGGRSFSNLLLAPNTDYRAWLLEADTLLVGRREFRTREAGVRTVVPEIFLRPHNTLDADEDGLPDVAEFIAGTDPRNPDTDGDGLADGAEVRQGLNPLDGLVARTGIIASVDTSGIAVDVCTFNDVAIVADSAAGITVFNIFNGLAPIRIAQVDTPGNALAVSCTGNLIAVADGGSGVAIVDFTEPPNARISAQVPLSRGAQDVATAGPLAYAAAGPEIVLIDMPSGTILDRRSYSTETIEDLAVAGDALYVLSADRSASYTIRKVPLGGSLEAPASVFRRDRRPAGRMHLFAGGGLVYVGGVLDLEITGFFNAGIEILRDAGAVFELLGAASRLRAFDVEVNGSGLAVFTLTSGVNRVAVLDVRDPTVTDRVLRAFDTPGPPQAVSIYNGLAYVADRAGLLVIAYEPYEIGGAPPAIELAFSFPDDPPRAQEGQLVRITARVEDDVQVRNVEFYRDGLKVGTDGNFPFEHRFVTPTRDQQPSFTLRARAFDTAGNSAFTDEVVVVLVEDATRPEVVRTIPADGSFVAAAGSVSALFSEPVKRETLTRESLVLAGAGADGRIGTGDDVEITGGTLEFRDGTLGFVLPLATGLAPGVYRASLAPSISDLAGNSLETAFEWSFAVLGPNPIDTDQDGLPDVVEIILSLDPLLDYDPLNPDTDGDGIADGDEDIDRDGATNAQEVLLGTNLRFFDTDRDGILDGDEDNDLDGLRDVDELAARTDPLNPDTDGDDFLDGEEVADGSDPKDARSTPLRTIASHLSARNTIAPAAAERAVEGRAISVKNESAP